MNEGDKLMVTSVRRRHECFICGEDATKRHTYLLPRARSNPKSAGYGKDDISRCEDEVRFTCDEHDKIKHLDVPGYEWCGTYTYGKQYEHLFFYWKETGREEFLLKKEPA